MALRHVFQEGDPVLRKKSRPVEKFDDRLQELIADLLETMREENGVGLAAPQVGVLKRLFVMNTDEEGDPSQDLVIINPEFILQEGEQHEIEGCLSLPGLYGYVDRPAQVRIRYQDPQGNWQELEGDGLTARCICHESDHLEGVLFEDKIVGNLFRYNKEGRAIDVVTGEEVELVQHD
ncbi:MAG: peptide deformylase [Eubacteriales bacterium]|nr:peptide deformylase [Eubacteriales bacterium]